MSRSLEKLQLDSLVRILNDTLVFLTENEVSETVNDQMLEAIQKELKKIDQTNVSQTLVRSIESVKNDLKVLKNRTWH